jgi:hypothetical protein
MRSTDTPKMPAADTRRGTVLIPTAWVMLAAAATDPAGHTEQKLTAGHTLAELVLQASEMPR